MTSTATRAQPKHIDLNDIVRHLAGDDRIAALHQLLDRPVENPQGWYLLGTELIRTPDLSAAARAFGMAYHQDVSLTSAAVMTFSCLKAARSNQQNLRTLFIETWQEMKKPPLGANASERKIAKLLRPSDTQSSHTFEAADVFFDRFFESAQPTP